jgi:hypothetical protein
MTVLRLRRAATAGIAAGLLSITTLAGPARAVPPHHPGASGQHHRDVCGDPGPGRVRCLSEVVTPDDGSAEPLTSTGPFGYGPADLQSAYALPSATAGAGRTIAIVDAYDNPYAESDLGVYRSQYGLPPCTTANGCFKKVNQSGGTTPPRGDVGWGQEIALDLDAASAVCPNCKLLLVEAASNGFGDLLAAEDYAAAHATVVSNSWGAPEFSSETTSTYASHFNHPGVPITVSSGDDGYGVQFPAASGYVTAVGGTSLDRAPTARGWSESAWSGSGSGCSAYVAKPAWQADAGCARRTVADVSAVADPNTGVAVYDTYGSGGWLVFGGTSLSAPLVAGAYALAGDAGTVAYSGAYFYSRLSRVFDVTSGSNGSCGGSYLCVAGPGFDGPTGLGSPSGAANTPPPSAPTATTGTASAVGTTTATLGGTVNPNGQATTYHFEYGPTTAYGASIPVPDASAGSGTSAQAVSAAPTGLSASTTYHFRLVATSAGGTASGADASFTTGAVVTPPPTSGTAAPNALSISSGSLASGSVSSLLADDANLLQVASTRSSTRKTDWYATVPGVPGAPPSLTLTYAGATSASCSQTVYAYDWTTGAWRSVDTRTVGTSQVAITAAAPGAPADYVSGTGSSGSVRVRVRCTSTERFTTRANLVSVAYSA